MSISESAKTTAAAKSETLDAVIMNLSHTLCRDHTPDEDVVGLIDALNRLAETVGSVIEAHNGRLLSITKKGIIMMFGNCDQALQSAVPICQRAETASADAIHIGIDYGPVCVGSVGYKDFHMPLVMSKGMEEAAFLSENAQKYRARILVTGDAAAQIRDFQTRYNTRRLGLIYYKASKKTDDFYDVFDGDCFQTKYNKMRSRLFFETGVDLFLKGSYLEARSYFIELLKFDRDDAAAKQYIFKCDGCLQEMADNDGDKYLEIL